MLIQFHWLLQCSFGCYGEVRSVVSASLILPAAAVYICVYIYILLTVRARLGQSSVLIQFHQLLQCIDF